MFKSVTRLRLDSHTPEEVTFGSGNTKKQEDDRRGKRPVNTRLDGVENGPNNGTDEDHVFNRGNPPEAIRVLGRSDEVGDGVNNQGRKSRVGDPVESRGDSVQGNNNDDTSGETRSRGSHTSLRLEGRSRERTGRRVGREKSTNGVVDTDGDQLLVGVDLVTV